MTSFPTTTNSGCALYLFVLYGAVLTFVFLFWQKYEHYKTDELPNIEGSQFSPKVGHYLSLTLSFLCRLIHLQCGTYYFVVDCFVIHGMYINLFTLYCFIDRLLKMLLETFCHFWNQTALLKDILTGFLKVCVTVLASRTTITACWCCYLLPVHWPHILFFDILCVF